MSSIKRNKEEKRRSKDHLKVMVKGGQRHRGRSLRRVAKYGVASFARNAWLTVAATSIMIITLMIISVTVIAANVLNDTKDAFEDEIEFQVFLVQATPEEEVSALTGEIGRLETVRAVRMETPAEMRDNFIEQNKDNPDVMNALEILGDEDKFMYTIFIKLVDINNTAELDEFIETNEVIDEWEFKNADLENTKREAIANLGSTVSFIERLGIIVGAVFIVIASLIIFNTIRMAIFNRREEIQMMKLIGAAKGFVRGPFIVEAVMYGLVASGITVSLVAVGLGLFADKLEEYGIVMNKTLEILQDWWWVAVIGLTFIGILIGVMSAALAVRKYLRLR